MKTNDLAVAAGDSVDPARWQEAFEGLMSRVAGRFARVEPRRRVRQLVLGLLSDLPRKNCWTIAEWAGDTTPDGMQHLLGRAKWDADAVCGDVRGYVVDHLNDDRAVLVVDETGDVKKGTHTVGAQRQYTGTAGRIENAQVAVYLVFAGERGHAAVDRELYVPRSWTTDPDRCRAAGLPEETSFATKPELAARMVTRFLDAGHRAAWVAGDEVYGGNTKLRTALEERGIGHVLAVACSHEVTIRAGKFRVDTLAKKVPKRTWQKLSAGTGAKGHRYYDWAVIDLSDTRPGSRQLLIRRNRGTGELASPGGGGEAAGGQQRPDLADGLGHGAAVDVEQLCQGRVGEVQPQVREGDQHPVDEDQLVPAARTSGLTAFTLTSLVQATLALS